MTFSEGVIFGVFLKCFYSFSTLIFVVLCYSNITVLLLKSGKKWLYFMVLNDSMCSAIAIYVCLFVASFQREYDTAAAPEGSTMLAQIGVAGG